MSRGQRREEIIPRLSSVGGLDCCIVIHEGKTDELRVEGLELPGYCSQVETIIGVCVVGIPSGFLVCRTPAAFSSAFHLVLSLID